MPAKDKVREQRLLAGILSGKTPPRAALDAGFSEAYSRVNVYRWLAKESTQQRIQSALKEIEIDPVDALQTLDYQMKGDIADILPDNEILRAAKANGVSKLIKKIKQRERFIPQGPGKKPIREVVTDIEVYPAQGAAKHLSSLLMANKGDDAAAEMRPLSEFERRGRLEALFSAIELRALQRGAIDIASVPVSAGSRLR